MSANPQNKPGMPFYTIPPEQQTQQPIYAMPYPQPEPDDEINLMDYWRILMRFKWLIILLTLIGGGSAVAVAYNMTPVYRAEVTMSPVGQEKSSGLSALAGQFGGLASLAGINMGGGDSKIQESIATLQSRVFTDAFIRDEKLMPVLFSGLWNSETQTWQLQEGQREPNSWDAFKQFDGIRSIADDKKSGMYTLAFEWHDPKQAADWANLMVSRINQHQKLSAINEAKKSIAYLEAQLNETSVVEMRQSIFRLIEAQTKNIMLANVRDEFIFKIIDPAVIPQESIKPKKQLMAVLGTMVGFMLGVFLAFFIAFIKNQKEKASTDSSSEPVVLKPADQKK